MTEPSEMVRRMARAIHDECEGVTGPNDDSGGGTYLRATIAALKVMREPADEMLAPFHIHKFNMRRNWQDMIDTALGPDK